MKASLALLGINVELTAPSQIFDDSFLIDSGIPASQKRKLTALRTIIRQLNQEARPKRAVIKSANDVYKYLRKEVDHLGYEELHCLFLKNDNSVVCVKKVTSGGTSSTVIDVKQIAIEALKEGASNIIMVHNHPSGSALPSKSDIEATRKIRQGLRLLEMELLDHVIIGQYEYYSFADEKLTKR